MGSAEQRDAIEATAARLYLQARTTDAEGDWEAAYSWVAEHPAHGVAFAKAEASWELTEELRDARLTLAPEEIAGPAGHFEALFSRRTVAGLLAASLIGSAGAFAVQKWADVERYRTRVGEERTVRLADGSVVRLNTDSAIEWAIRDDERVVRLLRGEASFQVAHDSLRPFLVHANATVIRAVGTDFNVRLRPEFIELTVTRGSVAVRDGPAAPRLVDAGDGAAIRGGAVAVSPLGAVQIARRTAWQSGVIRLDGQTLGHAVDEFNRYRPAPLVVGDPQLGALRVAGAFPATRSDLFVAGLQERFGIRAVAGGDRSLILMPPGHGRSGKPVR